MISSLCRYRRERELGIIYHSNFAITIGGCYLQSCLIERQSAVSNAMNTLSIIEIIMCMRRLFRHFDSINLCYNIEFGIGNNRLCSIFALESLIINDDKLLLSNLVDVWNCGEIEFRCRHNFGYSFLISHLCRNVGHGFFEGYSLSYFIGNIQ